MGMVAVADGIGGREVTVTEGVLLAFLEHEFNTRLITRINGSNPHLPVFFIDIFTPKSGRP